MKRPRRLSGQITDAAGVAEMVGGFSSSWFRKNRKDLEAEGFPLKDELLGGWHKPAVQAWLDRRSGTVVRSTAEDKLMERAKAWTGSGHA
jgi:hypothetical protein